MNYMLKAKDGSIELFVPSMLNDGTFVRHVYRWDGVSEYPRKVTLEEVINFYGASPVDTPMGTVSEKTSQFWNSDVSLAALYPEESEFSFSDFSEPQKELLWDLTYGCSGVTEFIKPYHMLDSRVMENIELSNQKFVIGDMTVWVTDIPGEYDPDLDTYGQTERYLEVLCR